MAVRELVENSFPYDEPLLVRDHGRVKVMRIGELVEREFAAGEALRAEDRWYKHLEEPLEALTLDESLKLAFRRITAVFKHPSPKKLWKVQLQAGKEVRTTSVHNVFVVRNDFQVVGKETRLLEPGDRVVVPTAEFMTGDVREIDLLEELTRLDKVSVSRIVARGVAELYPVGLPKSELLLLAMQGGTCTRRGLHEVADRLGFSNPDNLIHTLRRKGVFSDGRRGEYKLANPGKFKHPYTIPRDWIHCDAVPLGFLKSSPPPQLETAEIRFSVKQGRSSLPRRIQVSPEFMRVLGYYTSEGSVHAGSKVSFSFGCHEMDTYVKDLVHCLGSAFGIKPTVTVEHGSAVNVVVNDSILGLFLESVLGAGSNSSNKRVPWIVLNVPRTIAEEYLNAYIRGDGHVQIAKRNRKIALVTSSDSLFTDLKFLLALLGRHYTASFKGPSERTVKGVRTRFKGSHIIYIRQGRSPESCSVPLSGYRDNLLALAGHKTNIYRKSVQKNWLKTNFTPEQLPKQLRRYVYSDAGAVGVRRVKEYTSKEKWVYDVAVEGVERFIGGGAVALLHNSLDACEMARMPPELYVRIIPESVSPDVPDPRPYRLTVTDNGPGVAPQHVPSAFGKVFYGSKYVLRQSRGMFGLGGTMAILYGQITTNKPVVITTSHDGKKTHTFQMIIDIGENRPVVLKRSSAEADGTTGTRVDLTLEGDFLRASQKIGDYFRQTALVASYANITFVDPAGQVTFYEKATSSMPAPPQETLPHPHGIDVEAFKRIVKLSEAHDMKTFMVAHFHRVGEKIASRFLEFAGVSPRLAPKRLDNTQIVRIVDALQRFPDFLQPDAAVLSPVEEEILLAGVNKELQPEFSTVVTRPPSSYSGFPFLVEVAVAYGGKVLQSGVKLFRFANRIPLLYDESSDVSFKVVNEDVDWRRYHVPQEAPVAVVTHICSTRIPYKTVGKEYIADRPEIEKEIKNAAREALRRLGLYLSKMETRQAVQRKMNIYGKYLPLIAQFATDLADQKKVPRYRRLIGEGEKELAVDEANAEKETEAEAKETEQEQEKID